MTRLRLSSALRIGCCLAAALSAFPLLGLPSTARTPIRRQSSPQGRPSVRWLPVSGRTGQAVVEVSGLDADTLRQLAQANLSLQDWQQLLTVTAQPANATP